MQGTGLGELEKKVDALRKDVGVLWTSVELEYAAAEWKEMKEKAASLEAKIASNTNNVNIGENYESMNSDTMPWRPWLVKLDVIPSPLISSLVEIWRRM